MNQHTPLGWTRAPTLALTFALGVMVTIPLGVTWAQSTMTPPGLSPLGVPEAPVGHRQPRQSDLPPNVLREEQSNAPVQDNAQARRKSDKDQGGTFGEIPSICVRC
jgi:hypothetical protein